MVELLTYSELVRRLKEVKEMNWVQTHRKGPTGIGKTLEDLLGITENNVPGPDAEMIELKSARKNSGSMLTLFTKSPMPAKANAVLLQKFGYDARGKGKPDLHTTVDALRYNMLRGKEGFKVDVSEDKIELVCSGHNELLGYWDAATLKQSFERKLPRLMYVKADSRGKGENEEFWFNEAWLLSGFSFENLVRLVKEGSIKVDIRIGQYEDGRPHDHGTGFRVHPNKLDLCFDGRKSII